MSTSAKNLFLITSKSLGLFRLARLLTGKGLRILCYHGFAVLDEAEFRPMLFMTGKTFAGRLRILAKNRYPVLGLEDALQRMEQGKLPRDATVITIDDGFHSVHSIAQPLLQAAGCPATMYVTTYYVQKSTPIFRLVVQYAFWRTTLREIRFSGKPWIRDQTVDLTLDDPKKRATWEIIGYGEQSCKEEQRQEIAQDLAGMLGVDYRQIRESRCLSLMNPTEVKELAASGIDVQLHTHRHRLPTDSETGAREEILSNRSILEGLVGKPLRHFCYPSGIWSETQWPWLEGLAIESATTCEPGLNYRSTPRLGLRRFLDAENIHPIVFEAEISGYLELLRQLRDLLRTGRTTQGASRLAHVHL